MRNFAENNADDPVLASDITSTIESIHLVTEVTSVDTTQLMVGRAKHQPQMCLYTARIGLPHWAASFDQRHTPTNRTHFYFERANELGGSD